MKLNTTLTTVLIIFLAISILLTLFFINRSPIDKSVRLPEQPVLTVANPKNDNNELRYIDKDSILQQLTVLELDSVNGIAVVKIDDGELSTLYIGDVLINSRAKLSSVTIDKLVFTEIIANSDGGQEEQTVWIYKAVNGVSRVQRFYRQAPPIQQQQQLIPLQNIETK